MDNLNIIYKTLKWSSLLILALAMGACSSDDDDMDAYFELSKSEIQLDYKGLTEDGVQASFEIGTSKSWEISSIDEWLVLNHTSGEQGRTTLFLKVSEVGIHGGREGTIVFKSGKETRLISVVQAKKVETMALTPRSIEVGKSGLLSDGESPSVSLTTNSDWKVEPAEAWIVPDIKTGVSGTHKITLTIEQNNESQAREAYVMIYSGESELADSVLVKQSLEGLETSIYNILANKDGDIEDNAGTFTIKSATAWTATADSWTTLNPSTGASGATTVTVSLASYTGTAERTGKITVTSADGLTSEIAVTQSHKSVVYEDDGKAVGYVYLLEDFAWCAQFGGNDQVANPLTSTTIAIYGSSDNSKLAKAAFDTKGYEDFKPLASCMYIAAHYLKMNKGNNQTGFVVPSIPNLGDRLSSNIKLSFDAAPNINTSYNQDNVDITVEISEGPGSVDIDDGITKESASTKITVASYNEWHNMDFVLYGVTSASKIVIRTTKQGESGYYRWFLDNVKFEKHSVVQ